MKWISSLTIFLCLIVSSCKKDYEPGLKQGDTNILAYSISNTAARVSIVLSERSINITFPDSVMKADDLIANFTLSPGCKAIIKNTEQISGVSKNNYTTTFYYTVSGPGSTSDWKVTATNNAYTANLGLGNFMQQFASNNCAYTWYRDQAYTGAFSYDNCGPTAVTMACKWSDSTFTKIPEDARMAYRPSGGYWYPDDITFYLRDNHIPNSTVALPATLDGTMQILQREVDLQQLVIVCLEMNDVTFNGDDNSHVDRFYTATQGTGHFILVKGYKKVNNQIYFEVYDPNSFTRVYEDGTLKGKDRYYRSEDLFEATKTWWPKVFIVAKKGTAIIE